MNVETNAHQDLFSEQDLFVYEEASAGQRFLNLLIDSLLMRFGLSNLTSFVVGRIIFVLSPETENYGFVNGFVIIAYFYLMSIVNILIYYTICEKAFNGKTLGKLITGTKAIMTNGHELSFKKAVLRSLTRVVPFEVFSAFGGYTWHDKWTSTMVIKTR